MIKIPVKLLISLGLTVFLVGLLLLAAELKLVTNPVERTMQSRALFCETIAISSSLDAKRGEFGELGAFLTAVVKRNSAVLSAGMRRKSSDRLLASTGGHRIRWAERGVLENETHTQVPIMDAMGNEWGHLEIVFTPISNVGLRGVLDNHVFRLIIFVGGLSFVTFYWYLDRMLKVMSSKSVPQRVRTALSTLAGGLIVADANGDIVLANDAVSHWFGRSPEKLVGASVSDFPWVLDDGEELPWKLTYDSQVPMSGTTLKIEAADGDRTLIASSSPMVGNDGALRGVFIGLEDVTVLEQKKIEHEMLRQEAERANSAKSDFLARMSHEIRTPMNAILGFTDVLRRGFDNDYREREEYLNTIHSSGEHLLSLINDILDLSKVEAGRMELESTQCSPHKIILETLEVLRVKADQKGLDLSYEPVDGVPELILGDPVRMRQIVTNLVGNAIKFTENGAVRVTSRLVGREFEFAVIDSGIGISEEAVGRIFDPFSQADSSVTRKFGGTGLGLAIAKRFAEAMGGGIRAESELGAGTSFIVTISPGNLDGIRRIDALEAQRARRIRDEQTVDAELPPSRILVVDDGESNRKLLRLFLERAGGSIVEATNGQEAVDFANEKDFDVILLDMQMPVMDGYTAASVLRERGSTTPIVALTAHAMKEDEAKCFAAGCSHFLPKPVDSNKLLQLMSDILGGQTRTIEPSEVARQESHAQQATASQPTEPLRASAADVSAPASADTGATSSKEDSLPLIRSSLPVEDEDFREIVVEFIDRLHEQLEAMCDAYDSDDLDGLARLAHWLKGSGGTAGFGELTEPAKNLEIRAKQGDMAAIPDALQELRDLTQRIEVPVAVN